jgi:hypothetical protein
MLNVNCFDDAISQQVELLEELDVLLLEREIPKLSFGSWLVIGAEFDFFDGSRPWFENGLPIDDL